MTEKLPGSCWSQGKRMYASRHAAEVDARRMGGHCGIYRCRCCKKYHVTHYPKRVLKAFRLLGLPT